MFSLSIAPLCSPSLGCHDPLQAAAKTVKTTLSLLFATLTWLPPGLLPWGQSMVGPEGLVTVTRWPLNGSPNTVLRSYQTCSPSNEYEKI